MTTDPPEDSRRAERDKHLSRIVASYLEAADAGRPLDRGELLRQHPDLASDLQTFFKGQDELQQLERESSSLARAIPAGESVGDYEVLEEISRGGMGVVYRARQKSLNRTVALKMILAGGLATEEEVRRFRNEAEAAAGLDHPNIVPIHEVGQFRNQYYYSMRLVEGGNLEENRERFAGAPRAIAQTIETVARAVHHAHQCGILHRDLKPANILVDSSGRPHVTDFGLAKAIQPEGAPTLTRTGAVVGTPKYMAPEQAAGEKGKLSAAVDVYSLGAILYELLTGQPPLSGKTPIETLRRVIDEDPPAARLLNPKVPRDLDTIAQKCLEKDPGRRYESAAALAEDLVRFLRHEPIRARPPGLSRRLWKTAVRHRVATAALAVGVVATAIFLGISWQRAESAYRRACQATRNAIASGNLDAARRSLAFLEEAYSSRSGVARLAEETTKLERQVSIRQSYDLREQGEALVKEFQRLRTDVESLERQRTQAEERHLSWEPFWERRDEIEAWYRLCRAQEEIQKSYSQAILSFSRALEVAPATSEASIRVRRDLEDLYYDRYKESLEQGFVRFGPAFFKEKIESLSIGTYATELEGGGRVALSTEPEGADVFCFRYERHEERLLPIPFAPRLGAEKRARGLRGAPFLEVEKIWDSELSPFEAGDRLLEVDGRAVGLIGDLAGVLSDVKEDHEVPARVLRRQESVILSWVPFPRQRYEAAEDGLRPGRVIHTRDQFGFTLAGYPLDFVPGCHVGVTRADSPLEIELPKGSYLFVLRKQGFTDTRFPVCMPRERSAAKVRLLREERIPPGFLYIPAGAFPCGGDREAFQSLEYGETPVEGFFISRLEVTVGEYLEFVNDPEVLARTGEDGRAPPISEAAREQLPPGGTVQLIPWDKKRRELYWERHPEEGWKATRWRRDWPLLNVPQLAALEFAHWRTQGDEQGWRYRLPTDLEWEKAARGVDRRPYVWGNYLVWNYCWSNRGNYRRRKTPDVVGSTPADESVYGVRDMAGSVNEHTASRPLAGYRGTSLRGGDWSNLDAFCFRIATRNSRLPENAGIDTGIRLAADLEDR